MSKYIYTYRLTCFNGAAPCFDNNLLSLAICKRDMRRVIGNRIYNQNEKPETWMIGFVGKALADTEPFKKYTDKQVLYIAKVTDVKEYHEYFGTNDKYKGRRDNIYIPCDETTDFKSDVRYFRHKPKSAIHNEKWLQQRDFDISHPNSKKYVLLSDQYCFISEDDSEQILKRINNADKNGQIKERTKRLIPSGLGHCWFTDDSGSIIEYLECLTKKYKSDRNVKSLPNSYDIKNCSSCCGDKREDTI